MNHVLFASVGYTPLMSLLRGIEMYSDRMHPTYERLLAACATRLGWKRAADIARRLTEAGVSVSPQMLGNWKANGISKAMMIPVAKAIDISPVWLATGEGPQQEGNVIPGPDIRGTVPVISQVQAGEFAEAIDNLSPGEGERIRTSYPVRKHTFALRVVGDSMEPDFPEGLILIVEPEMEPRPGDYVIAKNGGDATFKQLVRDGGDWYLKPLNPRYPI